MDSKSVITLTLSESVENHKSMQILGEIAKEGFNLDDLMYIKSEMEKKGATCQLVSLNKKTIKAENAYVLLIKQGVDVLLSQSDQTHGDMFQEQIKLKYDKKAYSNGRIINKKARYNLCFDYMSQKADFKNKKGTVVNIDTLPVLKNLMTEVENNFGKKAQKLKAEGNYYYDVYQCGISWHGDSERKKVIGVRLGDYSKSMPIYFRWYRHTYPVQQPIRIDLSPGDIYIMSEKAVGNDWCNEDIYTLRHATGANRYTNMFD